MTTVSAAREPPLRVTTDGRRAARRPKETLIHGGRHIELDGGDAFVPDCRHASSPLIDSEAEAFGEELIAAATSAEAVAEPARNELLASELDERFMEVADDDEE